MSIPLSPASEPHHAFMHIMVDLARCIYQLTAATMLAHHVVPAINRTQALHMIHTTLRHASFFYAVALFTSHSFIEDDPMKELYLLLFRAEKKNISVKCHAIEHMTKSLLDNAYMTSSIDDVDYKRSPKPIYVKLGKQFVKKHQIFDHETSLCCNTSSQLASWDRWKLSKSTASPERFNPEETTYLPKNELQQPSSMTRSISSYLHDQSVKSAIAGRCLKCFSEAHSNDRVRHLCAMDDRYECKTAREESLLMKCVFVSKPQGQPRRDVIAELHP